MKTEKMILTIAIALVLTAVSCKEKPLPDTSDSVKASDTSVVTDTSVDNNLGRHSTVLRDMDQAVCGCH